MHCRGAERSRSSSITQPPFNWRASFAARPYRRCFSRLLFDPQPHPHRAAETRYTLLISATPKSPSRRAGGQYIVRAPDIKIHHSFSGTHIVTLCSLENVSRSCSPGFNFQFYKNKLQFFHYPSFSRPKSANVQIFCSFFIIPRVHVFLRVFQPFQF